MLSRGCFFILLLSIFSIFTSFTAIASESQDKYQRKYDMLVEGCICDWLDLEAKNNTYLSYSRIVSGCNGLIPDNIFFSKNFKPSPFFPQLNQVECKVSAANWIESK